MNPFERIFNDLPELGGYEFARGAFVIVRGDGEKGGAGGEKTACQKRFNNGNGTPKLYDGVFTQEFIDTGGEDPNNRGFLFTDDNNNSIMWDCSGAVIRSNLSDLEQPPPVEFGNEQGDTWGNITGEEIQALAAARSIGEFPERLSAELALKLSSIFNAATTEKAIILSLNDDNEVRAIMKSGDLHKIGFKYTPSTTRTLKLIFHTHQSPIAQGLQIRYYIPSPKDLTTSQEAVSPKAGLSPEKIMNVILNPQYIVFYYAGQQLAVYSYDGLKAGTAMSMEYYVRRDNGTIGPAIPLIGSPSRISAARISASLVNLTGQSSVVQYEDISESVASGEGSGKGEVQYSKDSPIKLIDEQNNEYSWEEITLATGDYTGEEGDVKIPTPYVVTPDGTVLEQGAKVLILFTTGRRNPVVLSSLMGLGTQESYDPNMRINKAKLARVRISRKNYDMEIEEDGKINISTKGSVLINSTGDNAGIKITSDEILSTEGIELNEMLGDIIEVGGNHNTRRNQLADNLNQKAEKVNVYSKKIILGHSNERGKEIAVDTLSKYLQPKLQNGMMGVTWMKLMEILIDKLLAAQYIGNGVVVKISVPDKQNIINDVRNHLNKCLSNVVYLLKEPNQYQ